MAIAFVSKGTSAQASSSSVILNKPTTVNTGDCLVAIFMIVSTTATITVVPTGWTLLKSQTGTNDGHFVYTKKATSSEPSTYTWTVSTGVLWMGGTMDYSGVDTTTAPFNDGTATSQAPSSSSTHTCLTMTTLTDGAMVIGTVASTTILTETPPGTLTERFDAQAELGVGTGECAAGDEIQTTAGSTGSFAWSSTAMATYTSITFALLPSGGPVAKTLSDSATESGSLKADAALPLGDSAVGVDSMSPNQLPILVMPPIRNSIRSKKPARRKVLTRV